MKRKSNTPPPNSKALSKQWNEVRRNVISHELGHWLVELQGLPAGTPVAIAAEGRWWPYVCVGCDNLKPEATTSFGTSEEALQAAREASAQAGGSEAAQ